MACQIGRHIGRPQTLGLKRADLLVDGADLGTLGIAQYRTVDGAGDMVLLKLGGRAGIDQASNW
jgi:hypothetical protein